MSAPGPHLAAEDRARFLEQGYLVVPDVVPAALCDRVIAAIRAFTGVDPDDPATFSRFGAQGHGIVPLHHHQALWDVRQLPALHAVFAFLYGTEQLWVTQDRVSCKVPARCHADGFRMDAVHWDGDPRALAGAPTRDNPGASPGGRALAMQGLVYLTDTPAEMGAFAMVPELYRTLDAWLAQGRSDTEIRRPDIAGYPLVPVPGGRGALVVWNRLMPHTSLANESDRPRLVQYVTMTPARADADAERRANVRNCLGKHPPGWALRQNVPGQLDPEPGPPVMLTALGRRLIGLDRWP
jgi:ectoine hydroxylase-related dioxygenase (phytanoyl-CoA dioxygenase family)